MLILQLKEWKTQTNYVAVLVLYDYTEKTLRETSGL